MEELTKDLQSAIEQHLPKQVGDILSKRLQSVSMLENTIKEQTAAIGRLEEAAKRHGDLLGRETAIETKEKKYLSSLFELDEKERNIKITLLEAEKKNLSDNFSRLYLLMETLFKNPVFKSSRYESINYNTGYAGDNRYESGRTINDKKEVE